MFSVSTNILNLSTGQILSMEVCSSSLSTGARGKENKIELLTGLLSRGSQDSLCPGKTGESWKRGSKRQNALLNHTSVLKNISTSRKKIIESKENVGVRENIFG
jgi:hypothetical protein